MSESNSSKAELTERHELTKALWWAGTNSDQTIRVQRKQLQKGGGEKLKSFLILVKKYVRAKNVKRLSELFLWSAWYRWGRMSVKWSQRRHYGSCRGLWRERLWSWNLWIFMHCPLFAHFIACRRLSCSTAIRRTPPPLSFLLSFGPSANDKGSAGREGSPLRQPLVPSMGWSQGRGVLPSIRDRASQAGASVFF